MSEGFLRPLSRSVHRIRFKNLLPLLLILVFLASSVAGIKPVFGETRTETVDFVWRQRFSIAKTYLEIGLVIPLEVTIEGLPGEVYPGQSCTGSVFVEFTEGAYVYLNEWEFNIDPVIEALQPHRKKIDLDVLERLLLKAVKLLIESALPLLTFVWSQVEEYIVRCVSLYLVNSVECQADLEGATSSEDVVLRYTETGQDRLGFPLKVDESAADGEQIQIQLAFTYVQTLFLDISEEGRGNDVLDLLANGLGMPWSARLGETYGDRVLSISLRVSKVAFVSSWEGGFVLLVVLAAVAYYFLKKRRKKPTRIQGIQYPITPQPMPPPVPAQRWTPELFQMRKNPLLAGVLSLIPGLGQIYAGKIRRGILLFFVTVLTLSAGIGVIAWLYSAYDAYRIAKRFNEKLLALRRKPDKNEY